MIEVAVNADFDADTKIDVVLVGNIMLVILLISTAMKMPGGLPL